MEELTEMHSTAQAGFSSPRLPSSQTGPGDLPEQGSLPWPSSPALLSPAGCHQGVCLATRLEEQPANKQAARNGPVVTANTHVRFHTSLFSTTPAH